MPHRDLLLVAGEASGDLHGSRLLEELGRRVPDLRAFGFGGQQLRTAGLEVVSDANIAVVGIVEVLKVLGKAREVFRLLLEEVDRRRPRAAVLIDFPEFNLRLARELHQRGIPVIYYVSPQVWAWRRRRVKKIARIVDKMLVLFPFEVDFYRLHGVAVSHVGHPLVDEVPRLPHVWDEAGAAKGPFRLALLPGSRRSEIEALLAGMLEAARLLARSLPVQVSLIQAPTVPRALLDDVLLTFPDLPVEVVDSDRYRALAGSHLALCASGTATLETGLVGTPMIVLYRLAGWTYALGRLLIRLPHISLVNLVLGRGVVPELLQGETRPERVASRAESLLRDPEAVRRMRRGLAELRERLGTRGATGRAAREVAAYFVPEGPETEGPA